MNGTGPSVGDAAPPGRPPRVLHLYDAADVGATLVKYGRRASLPWRQFDAVPPEPGPGLPPARRALRQLASAGWQARRAAGILAADLLHVHSGSRTGIVRSRPHRPFVLHLHGTDIRTQYYDPARRAGIAWGLEHAAAVLFSTPDLAVHAQAARADAEYLPNPVDPEELPAFRPADRPRIVFASRWEAAKGGRAQLELARAIAAAVGPGVRLEGLDWGADAAEAAATGITLLPRMPKRRYLDWLAGAHAVVGQSAGILAMSDLQAVGIGVPVAMSALGEGYYPGPVPVLQGSPAELAEQLREVLDDPPAASARLGGPQWVRRHHGPEPSVQQLAGIYRRLHSGR
ncbi:glycosyltransferase [Arthrobacter sp. I2-34]|uniref:Glycosyltransferase n=1 Tax=Arthrobacter hankyongi TaxID=2904801 RepID=A0ABS9L7Q4_9MICC|nr:glycosyltransferase [Arthrobacter hankyongi]MCG2622707.1 glycosyltransferase [Arthrobacter hankyongi]